MKKALKFILPILVLAASLVGAQRMIASRPVATPSPTREQVYAVETIAVERGPARPEFLIYGTVISGRSTELAAQVAGPVIAVAPALVEGGIVEAGQVLVEIDPADYQSALADIDAQLRAAQAQAKELAASLRLERSLLTVARERVATSKRDVDRLIELAARSAASTRSLDESRLKLLAEQQSVLTREQRIATLEAQIEGAQANIDGLKIRREKAARNLERTRLRAPFTAFVTGRSAEIGERVSQGQIVATLVDAERLEVAAMSGKAISRCCSTRPRGSRDAMVTVRWRLGRRHFDINATIDRQGGEIDPATGGVKLYARLIGPIPKTLRPGAFVELVIPARRLDDVVRLPETALYEEKTVYAVANGRLEARPVTVEARQGDTIWVRGPLAHGDQVLTTRLAIAAPGLRVTPISTTPATPVTGEPSDEAGS